MGHISPIVSVQEGGPLRATLANGMIIQMEARLLNYDTRSIFVCYFGQDLGGYHGHT